jgi:hypothetical protein
VRTYCPWRPRLANTQHEQNIAWVMDCPRPSSSRFMVFSRSPSPPQHLEPWRRPSLPRPSAPRPGVLVPGVPVEHEHRRGLLRPHPPAETARPGGARRARASPTCRDARAPRRRPAAAPPRRAGIVAIVLLPRCFNVGFIIVDDFVKGVTLRWLSRITIQRASLHEWSRTVAHLIDKQLVERANTALLLGILWAALAICVLAALAYDIRYWFEAW